MNIWGKVLLGRVESKYKGPGGGMGVFHFIDLENLGSLKLTLS